MKGIILFEAPAGEWLWGNRESSFLVLTVVRVRCWSRNSELYVPATACNRRGIRSPVDAGEAGSGAYPRAGHFTDGKENSREGEFHGRAREIWTESRRSSEPPQPLPSMLSTCARSAPGNTITVGARWKEHSARSIYKIDSDRMLKIVRKTAVSPR